MFRIFTYLLLVNLSIYGAKAQSKISVQKLQKIPLKALNGKTDHIMAGKATAFVFLSPECPLCQNYVAELNALKLKYPNVEILGLIPGNAYKLKEISAFKDEYKVGFTLLVDDLKLLTSALNATTTPEVILIDKQGALKYRGLIDNWAESLGVKRKVITSHYLNDALANLTTPNYPVKITKPVGCLINDK